MAYHEIIHTEIWCDFPGCNEYLMFSNEGWEKIEKMIKAIGWTHFSFPSEEDEYGITTKNLIFCSNCKAKEILPNQIHKCIYMKRTKKGKPSQYGSVLECVFCGRLKR